MADRTASQHSEGYVCKHIHSFPEQFKSLYFTSRNWYISFTTQDPFTCYSSTVNTLCLSFRSQLILLSLHNTTMGNSNWQHYAKQRLRIFEYSWVMNVQTTKNIEKLNGDLIICNKLKHITTVSGLQQGKPALKKLTYHHSEKIMV